MGNKSKSTAAKKLSFSSYQCRHDASKKGKEYVRLFEDLLSSPAYQKLDPYCVWIYLDMLRKNQFKDDFMYTFDKEGERFSKTVFYRSIRTLMESGFIKCIEYNHRNSKANIYEFHHGWHDIL